ncbi:hypothetical protein QAD02_002043 [Eretmocerus hayati]|uniref:Uncharacterized protein n=1 Tax=Eretmocerus hayati TaxID=131215 RepID=A0ACC2NI28_9HYME|nr:hypothetical protein QAD02_002043 [Eretmocerus hayati]
MNIDDPPQTSNRKDTTGSPNDDDNRSVTSDASSTLTLSSPTDKFLKNQIQLSHFMDSKHSSPFIIHIQHIERKKLDASYVGSILIEKYHNVISDLYNVSNNKVSIESKDIQTANQILDDEIFHSKGLRAFIPFHFFSSNAIIRRVPLNISMQELVNLSSTPNNSSILEARRINRRVQDSAGSKFEPSTIVHLLFDSKTSPKFIRLNLVKFNTERYKARPKQWFKCWRFGHLRNWCNSKLERCSHCAGIGHSMIVHCPHANAPPCCPNCKQSHDATDPMCPVKRQQLLIHDLAYEEDISLDEARNIVSGIYKLNSLSDFPPLRRPTKSDSSSEVVNTNYIAPTDPSSA